MWDVDAEVIKISGKWQYTDDQGVKFIWYPETGKVECKNGFSILKAVEYFSRRECDILWEKSVPSENILYVYIPDNDDKEYIKYIASWELKSAEELERESRPNMNFNKRNGKPITWNCISAHISRMIKTGKSRQEFVDWFNTFNLEDIRRRSPLMEASMKSLKVIIGEGKSCLKRLHDKGILRRLTPLEIELKLDKYKYNNRFDEE